MLYYACKTPIMKNEIHGKQQVQRYVHPQSKGEHKLSCRGLTYAEKKGKQINATMMTRSKINEKQNTIYFRNEQRRPLKLQKVCRSKSVGTTVGRTVKEAGKLRVTKM